MSIHQLIASKFIYGNPRYSIRRLSDFQDFIYRLRGNGTVYNGTQAHYRGFRKSHTFIYDWLAEEIYKYLNDGICMTMSSFDEWHEKTCNLLLGLLRRVDPSSKIGLSQKFVNLALKYSYCCGDAHTVDHLHKFDYCHVTLDQYTYWPNVGTTRRSAIYVRKIAAKPLVGTSLTIPFYTEMVNTTVSFSNLVSWSNLDYHSAIPIGYYNIQENIRTCLSRCPLYSTDVPNPLGITMPPTPVLLTPFQVEFLLW